MATEGGKSVDLSEVGLLDEREHLGLDGGGQFFPGHCQHHATQNEIAAR